VGEGGAGFRELRLDGADRTAEGDGDLGLGKVFVVAEDDS